MNVSNNIDLLGPWVWSQMGCGEWFPKGKTALGELNDDGDPVWAVVYDHYEKRGSIQVHMAIANPKYVTRRALHAVFEYPFYQLGVKKVLGIINSQNHGSLSLSIRLGLQVETVIKGAYERGDMYILSMTQEQCRWLRGKDYGLSSISTAAA